MTPDEMKAMYARMIEEMSNQGQAERAPVYFADDFVDYDGPPRGEQTGEPGWKKFELFTRIMKAAFPDRRVEIDFMTVDGDLLTARQTVTGTHTGPYMGYEPTGKAFRITAIDIYRYRDGKIAERWGNADSLGLMLQLGLAELAPRG